MYGTAVLAADTPAADIFGSAFVAIGLVFVVFRRRMAEDYPRLFFAQLPGWSRFGPTFLVVFGLLVAGLGVVAIVMGISQWR